MPAPIELIPLVCYSCSAAIPAGVEEVAWVCQTCGKGLLLDEERGTTSLEIHYMAGSQPGTPGKPYWVARGMASLGRRDIYGGGNQAQEAARFWQGERLFFIPAFACTLDQLIEVGTKLLLQPPALTEGNPCAFLPVVTHPADVKPYAEFILMGIEAGRKDKLRSLDFTLTLGEPALWVLP